MSPASQGSYSERARDALRRGDTAGARKLIDAWIRQSPRSVEARSLLGLALEQAGELRRADGALEQALRLTGGRDPALWFHRARVRTRLNDPRGAEEALRRSIQTGPDVAEPHNNLGVLLLAQGRVEEARDALRRAVDLRPDHANARVSLGEAEKRLGNLEVAEQEYRRALEVSPGHPAATNNLATLLGFLGRYREAVKLAAGLAETLPEEPRVWLNLAELQLKSLDPEAALKSVEEGRRRAPNDIGLLAQHYRVLSVLERFDEARELLEKGMPSAPRGMQRALMVQSSTTRHDDQVVPAMDPRGEFVEHYYSRLREDDWRDYDAQRERMLDYVREALEEGVAIVTPNTLPFLAAEDAALEHELARCYAAHIERSVPAPYEHSAEVRSDDRIRIGFASPAFGQHAVDHVTRDLYRLLDRQRFRVIGYSLSRRDDEWHRDVASLFDDFVDLSDRNNAAAAERIHQDGLDILVDLYGYGPEQRPEIFARRPAPIQLSQAGLVNTSGASWIDYRIASRAAMPDWLAEHFSEHIVHVPVTHHVMTGMPEDDRRPTRPEAGLPDDAFVYSCFQRPEKLTPGLLDAWAGILEAVPEGVIWLVAPGAGGRRNLLEEFDRRGIDSGRVVFAPRTGLASHVSRQYLADAFLNTFMFSGFNTVAVAAWCGVPVVTMPGRSFATRGAASVLGAIGMEDVVAEDVQGYRDTAIRLARDPDFSADVRSRLNRDHLEATLFNGQRNIRFMERAFEGMVERHRSGEPPAAFEIPDDRA